MARLSFVRDATLWCLLGVVIGGGTATAADTAPSRRPTILMATMVDADKLAIQPAALEALARVGTKLSATPSKSSPAISPAATSPAAGSSSKAARAAERTSSGSAGASSKKKVVAATEPPPIATEGNAAARKLPVTSAGRRSQLLGTGFRAQQRAGQVRLQTSTAVDLEPRTGAKGAAVFVLRGCRLARRNDRLPLDTRFFDSAVTRVSLRQRGADLEVMVGLRGPVTPVTRQEQGPSGTSVWVLEFPAAELAASP